MPGQFLRNRFGVEYGPPEDGVPPPPKGRARLRYDLPGLLRNLPEGKSMPLRRPETMKIERWQALISNAATHAWGRGRVRTHAENSRTVRVWRLKKDDGADA
jgi:hypothetical protein